MPATPMIVNAGTSILALDRNGKLYWDEIVIAQGQSDSTGALSSIS